MAVIIEIPPYATESVSGAGHTGLLRHVSKRTVTVIPIQTIGDRNATIVKISSVDEINILPAIAVEIGNAHPRTELLAIDRNAFVSFEMLELDPCRFRHVHKLNRRRMRILCVRSREQERKYGTDAEHEHDRRPEPRTPNSTG